MPLARACAHVAASEVVARTQGIAQGFVRSNIARIAGEPGARVSQASWLMAAFDLRTAIMVRFLAAMASASLSALAFLYALKPLPPAWRMRLGLPVPLGAFFMAPAMIRGQGVHTAEARPHSALPPGTRSSASLSTTASMRPDHRRIPRAWYRTRNGNFTLDGLLGFDLHGRSVGVVGTGKIGMAFARIMHGFGCNLLGFDDRENPEFTAPGGRYAGVDQMHSAADVLSLHCPLTPATRRLIDERSLAGCKPGLILINSSRGGIIDTRAVIGAIGSGRLGGVGVDVHEQEADLFYRDWSSTGVPDDVMKRLLSLHHVIVTGHQGFFTHEAMTTISQTTIDSIGQFLRGEPLTEELIFD